MNRGSLRMRRVVSRLFFLTVILLVFPALSSAQTAPAPAVAGAASSGAADQGDALLETRRQTLLFGIDSQILDLLKSLQNEKTTTLDVEIANLFTQSTNPDIQTAAIDYLDLVRDWRATTQAQSMLSDYASQKRGAGEDLVVAVIRYLSDAKDSDSVAVMAQLATDQSKAVAAAAIDAVGKSGNQELAAKLQTDLTSPDFPSDLKPQLLLALGDLKASGAVAELTKILANTDEDPVMRRYACYALGQIADPSSLDIITQSLRDKDSLLRAYAVSALGRYPGTAVDESVAQALRDDFWRVRIAAAQTLALRKPASAVPILEYKAKFDPEPNVELAAIAALGAIASPDALAFLRDLYSNPRAAQAVRIAALDAITAADLPGSLASITAVIDGLWTTDPTSNLLDYTCKKLSESKSPELKPLFLRFLDGPTLNIKIYGIRGIANNHLVELLDEMKQLTTDKNSPFIRQAAAAAVQSLK